ncbi:hypothetical protein N9J66_05290 [Gammaproteobacteria bacterium]|jgi:hypothetical protein|nr:hypothetical protein [Gammaproteobacteria bacterium]
MTKKYPSKIPWSMIDTDALAQSMERIKRENEKQNWKPYVDLSERKEKLKDHTKVYKDIYKQVKDDLHSDDPKRQGLAQLKLHEQLMVYTGRPLKQNELKNIIVQCEIKKPRMRLNAFGQLYTTKEINSFNDIEHK